MTEDVKFCKDCKFYKLTLFDRLFGMNRFGTCSNATWNETSKIDYLITGKKGRDKHYFASTMRTFSHECGEDAKWFEPKR
jgi:hypothetical protein